MSGQDGWASRYDVQAFVGEDPERRHRQVEAEKYVTECGVQPGHVRKNSSAYWREVLALVTDDAVWDPDRTVVSGVSLPPY